eukprot:1159461-Pelagomonas_calceolata.AAC.4
MTTATHEPVHRKYASESKYPQGKYLSLVSSAPHPCACGMMANAAGIEHANPVGCKDPFLPLSAMQLRASVKNSSEALISLALASWRICQSGFDSFLLCDATCSSKQVEAGTP